MLGDDGEQLSSDRRAYSAGAPEPRLHLILAVTDIIKCSPGYPSKTMTLLFGVKFICNTKIAIYFTTEDVDVPISGNFRTVGMPARTLIQSRYQPGMMGWRAI